MNIEITLPDGTTEELDAEKISGGATITAVVHRADGTTEDMGEIAHVDSAWEAK